MAERATGEWLFGMVLAAAVALLACDVGEHEPGKLQEGLTLEEASPERVAGTFVMNGVAIQFDYRSNGANVEAEVEASGSLRRLDGSELMFQEQTPEVWTLRILDEIDTSAPGEVVRRLQRVEPETPLEEIDTAGFSLELEAYEQARVRLYEEPEIELLPFLSYALGVEAGLEGHTYPATLSLHAMASRVAEVRGNDVLGGMSFNPDDEDYTHPHCHYNNSCHGRCGPGCTCWSWLCGSCYQRKGCGRHDFACHACYKHGHVWWCSPCNSGFISSCYPSDYHDMRCGHFWSC